MPNTKALSLLKTLTFNPYHIHTHPHVYCTYKQIHSVAQIHTVTSVTCEQLCVTAAIMLHLASCRYCAAAASAVVSLFLNVQTQRYYVYMGTKSRTTLLLIFHA